MSSATDNRTTELLPCPICGRKATVFSWWSSDEECGMANVGCSRESYASGYECARIHVARVDEKTALEDAIRIWNTRAELGSGTCIALPTDAAGEPIHVGDVLESTNAFKNWCVVVGIGDATKHDHIIYVKFEAAGDISQTWASKFIHRKPDAERGERKAAKR